MAGTMNDGDGREPPPKPEKATIAPVATTSASELAMSLAAHKDVQGAIVIVLDKQGTLTIGLGVIDAPEAQQAIGRLAKVLKAHCDEEWQAKKKSATGLFVVDDDDKQN